MLVSDGKLDRERSGLVSGSHHTRGPVPISRAIIRQHLINAGYSPEQIHRLMQEIPDPIDLERDGPILERLGITVGSLVEDAGGSP